MSLSSLHLDAFLAVARAESFSLAATRLHLTQSALSQRVLNLEHELGSTLFIREQAGVHLTELGEKLLRYCLSKEGLETEFLSHLKPDGAESLNGIVRVGAFSTIARSAVLPVLAHLNKKHRSLQIELRTEELRDLPPLLISGGTDFIFGIQPLEKQGFENHLVGYEENVLIQPSSKHHVPDVYLDHDREDMTTYHFLKAQGRASGKIKRIYLGDIDSIVKGVSLGMGKAVVPKHLIGSEKNIGVAKNCHPVRSPVYLTYYSQAFYTQLQHAVIDAFKQQISDFLKPSSAKLRATR